MLVPMTKVRILGRRREVERVVERAAAARPRGDRGRARRLRPSTSWAASRPVRRAANSCACSPRRWNRCWRGHAVAGRPGSRPRWTPLRAELERLAPPVEALDRRAGRAPRRGCAAARVPGAAAAVAPARARARRPRRRGAAPAAAGYGRARPQHRRRSDPRDAPRRARGGARGPFRAGLDAHRGRGDRLPRRLSARPTSRRSRAARARRRFATPRCPRPSSASRCARPSRRWSAGSRSFPEPSRRSSASARRWCAPHVDAPRGLQRAIADELERLDAVGPSSARRGARSSPSAGFRVASWRGCDARSRPAWAPPSSSRICARRRATRRRRC